MTCQCIKKDTEQERINLASESLKLNSCYLPKLKVVHTYCH